MTKTYSVVFVLSRALLAIPVSRGDELTSSSCFIRVIAQRRRSQTDSSSKHFPFAFISGNKRTNVTNSGHSMHEFTAATDTRPHTWRCRERSFLSSTSEQILPMAW
jgi:hypothetical protein